MTGAGVSSLDGLLTGTGSVYLINPNGVIVGRNGVVKVGGTFVASTLDTSDSGFLAGGPLSFAGASTASVVNLGKVGSLGGDVALIAAEVSNTGAILAPQGSAGLIAGHSVLMLRDGSLDEGRFSVLLGGSGTRATNSGLISAADAELRAEGGNVYALAGDTSGVIRATGVKRGGGKVWLVAQGGELDLGGAIDAQGADGTAGSVETSGGTVKIGEAKIDAHGGRWLVDPYDLTIDATAASTIDTALNAGTSVTEQTTASGYSGAGVASASGKGDITVAAPISWNTGAGLTLSAYRNVDVNASITSGGGGAINLNADNTGSGAGTVSFASGAVASTSGAVNIFYNPAGNDPLSINTTSYTTPTDYSSDVAGGPQLTAYMLVNTVYDLQNIANNVSGDYALGRNIDASTTMIWNGGAGFTPIGPAFNSFTGSLDGLSKSISNLYINRPSSDFVGLFASIGGYSTNGFGGPIQNLWLLNEQIVGGGTAGGLAGIATGGYSGQQYALKVSNVHVTGSVIGINTVGGLIGSTEEFYLTNSSSSAKVLGSGYDIGGLVGSAYDTEISSSYSSGSVAGLGYIGGLVGSWGSENASLRDLDVQFILNSYSTASVTGSSTNEGYVGGLVGLNNAGIANSYAAGKVTLDAACSTSSCVTGGLIGGNYSGGIVATSYFDNQTTGQMVGVGGAGASQTGVTGLTTHQFMNPANFSGFSFGGLGSGASWVIVDSDGTLNGSNGATRPILLSEYSTAITNAHQLQLMALNLSANYTLVSSIDASGTTNPSDVWGPAGFAPIGAGQSAPFSGTLEGQGSTIDSLAINRPGDATVGLFGFVSGRLADVGLVDEVVTGGGIRGSSGGGLAASLEAGGSVTDAFASVVLSSGGGGPFGGLVGVNSGVIIGSHATGSVSSQGFGGEGIGGLVGSNSGYVSASYASGSVSGAIPNGAGPVVSSGGLVGYNDGSLSNVYATGAVVGGVAGGLIAVNDKSGSIVGAYATGATTNHVNLTGDDQGGLVAVNFGTINNAYYDQGTTGQLVGVGSFDGSPVSQAGVTPIGGNTGQSPYSASSYSNLDFGKLGSGALWAIVDNDGTLNGSNGATRPILLSEYSTTITNAHQLQLMALDLSANYTLTSDIDASGTTNPSDVWSPAGFAPVGAAASNGGVPFSGTFDGRGAYDLRACPSFGRPADMSGLFGDVGASGVLQNVALTGGSVTGADYVGALAGQNEGLVRNASAAVPVTAVDYTGQGVYGYDVGGLVGANTGTVNSAWASGAVTGYAVVGGLVGGNFADPGVAVIENSHATGDVVEQGGDLGGGLVGQSATSNVSAPSLINDYATGHVTGTGFDGGLAGDVNSGLVQASYATGAVSGTTASLSASPNYGQGQQVGGLIGFIGHIQATTITGDYATGSVSGVGAVGGLIGGMRVGDFYPAPVTVENSYATGSVFGSGGTIGGLIGYSYDKATVSNSYATGPVNAGSGKANLVGGLVGTNAGTLSSDYATGQVGGDEKVGGLAGVNDGVISSSYATGAVTGGSGKTAAGSGQAVGGLVGSNTGQVGGELRPWSRHRR